MRSNTPFFVVIFDVKRFIGRKPWAASHRRVNDEE
jgi:hypothetical protein